MESFFSTAINRLFTGNSSDFSAGSSSNNAAPTSSVRYSQGIQNCSGANCISENLPSSVTVSNREDSVDQNMQRTQIPPTSRSGNSRSVSSNDNPVINNQNSGGGRNDEIPRDLKIINCAYSKDENIRTKNSIDASSDFDKKERDILLGQRCKELGNESYRRGMYEMAVEYYSQAINADGSKATYYTNRGLCHKKMGRWMAALNDAEQACFLDAKNIKGLYVKGEALLHIGNVEEALQALKQARQLSAIEQKQSLTRDIENSILKGKKASFMRLRDQRAADRKDIVDFFKLELQRMRDCAYLSQDEVATRLSQLDMLASESEAAMEQFEVPDFLTCKITMAMVQDPVITSSGITYERSLLLEHIARNGPFDPVTRQQCDAKHVYPNYAVKEAAAWFLERYPWAYDD